MWDEDKNADIAPIQHPPSPLQRGNWLVNVCIQGFPAATFLTHIRRRNYESLL